MDRSSRRLVLALAASIAGVPAGCAKPTTVRFEAPRETVIWPPPPDTARIRYLGAITSTADLSPKRSFGETVGDVLLGHEAPVGMVSPLGVCTDHGDRVFIADSNAQVVHVFDLSRQRYRQWTPPKTAPAFLQPIAITYDPAGRVLVSDSGAGRVFEFTRSGEYIGTIGDGLISRPCGLAVRSDTGDLYVADVAAHEVLVFDRGGQLVSTIGHRGPGPGEFNYPTHLAFDSAHNLFVSDSLNFRVQMFDAEGAWVRSIGKKGDVPGCFSQPKGVAIDPEDHVYVVDSNFEAVQVFDESGALLLSFGSEGHGPGEFWLPAGAWFDQTGRLWIADSYNRRIQVFQYLTPGGVP